MTRQTTKWLNHKCERMKIAVPHKTIKVDDLIIIPKSVNYLPHKAMYFQLMQSKTQLSV